MAVALVFLIIELVTPTLIFICFVAGGIVAGVYGEFYPDSYHVQVALFLVVSLILLPFTRKLASKITKPAPQDSNVDRMIGQVALVTREIDPDLGGQVKYEGEVWVAEAAERIEEHARVRIISIAGTRVLVERHNVENKERTE